jgi:5-methylcytosine-specific restriction endonuclease McrA
MKTLTHSHSPAPGYKVSPQGQQATHSPIKKGLCLYCGEVFNLKEYHPYDSICPDCLDIFGDEPEIGQQETGEA